MNEKQRDEFKRLGIEIKNKMAALTYLHQMGTGLEDVKAHFPNQCEWIDANMDRPFREVMEELNQELADANRKKAEGNFGF